MAVKRTRNYATVVYPDSAPDNWLELISELKIPCFISPLHDKDINANGEPKKPHWHVMLMFEGVKTEEQVKDIISVFCGVGLEVVSSLRGYARYLCHLDNPDKAQYNPADVMCYGGAEYFDIIGLASDRYNAVREIIQFVNENKILFFADLLEYASIHRDDWFRLLCDNSAYIVKEYIWSYNKKVSCGSEVGDRDEEN